MFISKLSLQKKKALTSEWPNYGKHLPTILSRFHIKDIYKADELGLYCQALLKKTMELKA